MNFVFYDTETTGLSSAFDQIVQFGAIVTDEDFNVLDEVNLRCRLQPHVLASPGAMFITKVGPKAIQSAPLSCYEMVCKIRAFIQKWTPATFIGFNSIGYDEGMLRQAFYQHLHPVYLTNTKGNARMDALVLAHAVATHRPGAINVPVNEKGKPTFKLSKLAQANRITLDSAHDALADTRATLDLVKYLRTAAPDIWAGLLSCRSKASALEIVADNEVVLFTDRAFSKSTIVAGAICASPSNPAYLAMFDLAYDPSIFLNIDVDKACRLLKSSPRPIRLLKANNFPIIMPISGDAYEIDLATAKDRLVRIREHPTFSAVISEALGSLYDGRDPSVHVEEQIFSGFPTSSDSILMDKFHAAPWAERFGIALKFADPRYRLFAERLLHAEAPEFLSEESKIVLDQWIEDRHSTSEEVPWLTIEKARTELEEIRGMAGDEHAELILEIADHYGR